MKDPVPVVTAFESARAGLPMTRAVQELAFSPKSFDHVMEYITNGMGIYKLAPMTNKSVDSMMSLVFYAGDGIVLKVGSSNFSPQAGPFEVPPITQDHVKGHDRLTDQYYDLTVSTYPYLSQTVSQRQIDAFEQEQLLPIGLQISPDDKHPRNFRAAPDANGTVLSIDTGSYTAAYNGNQPTQDLNDEFFAYMRLMFPAYDDHEIKPQDVNTSFDPTSPFDPRHIVTGFNVRKCLDAGESAIELADVHNITIPEKPIRPLWKRLFLPFGEGNTVDVKSPEEFDPA